MSANLGDTRNWLEQLAKKIPGYSGYVDRERRRDIDKLHRERLADRLRALKAPLTDLTRELSSGGRLMEVGPVESAVKKLDRLENRIRFASYGYTGFFDVVRIDEIQLDSIYRFDLELVDQVDEIERAITDLKTKAGSAEGLKAACAGISAMLDRADRKFDERYAAINNFSGDRPPGQPLFR